MNRITALFLPAAVALGLSNAPLRAEEPDVDCDAPQVQMEMTYCAEPGLEGGGRGTQ